MNDSDSSCVDVCPNTEFQDSCIEHARPALAAGTIWVMAITVGVIVANIYYAQPLLADIAHTFSLTVPRAGAIAMLGQIGTAGGMFLFVPLGDAVERKSLITVLLIAASASLVLFASAPTPFWLTVASFLVGATGANVHVVVPFAAHLAAPHQRGRVVGTVFSGVLFGILLARTFSGSLGAIFGWRSVYGIAAAAMLVLAVLVWQQLPVSRPAVKLRWVDLMRSTLDLVRKHSTLREASLLGALFFCSFSAFWTTLIFLLQSPAYHYGSTAAGLFGLVGAAGAAGAPLVGHLADKYGPRATVFVGLLLTLASFIVMGATGIHLAGLITGVLLMDLGVQIGHVSNQTRIYSLDPGARSRLNMVYMVCYFLGGALGSYLGAVSWRLGGWLAVSGFGAGAMLLAVAIHWQYGRTHAPRQRKHASPDRQP